MQSTYFFIIYLQQNEHNLLVTQVQAHYHSKLPTVYKYKTARATKLEDVQNIKREIAFASEVMAGQYLSIPSKGTLQKQPKDPSGDEPQSTEPVSPIHSGDVSTVASASAPSVHLNDVLGAGMRPYR